MSLDYDRLENMRDCVQRAFSNGCQRGHEFSKMRHAIIAEMRSLNFTSEEIGEALLEWNGRCERVLGPGEQRRQLLGYVDWALGCPECKTGCRALEDYCIGEENCHFHRRMNAYKRDRTPDIPFNKQELERFLSERFGASGQVMMLIVNALAYYQIQNATGEVMYIGFRGIASIIREKNGYTISAMEVHRKINMLIDEGIIELLEKGRSGTFSAKANGYRFLRWPRE